MQHGGAITVQLVQRVIQAKVSGAVCNFLGSQSGKSPPTEFKK